MINIYQRSFKIVQLKKSLRPITKKNTSKVHDVYNLDMIWNILTYGEKTIGKMQQITRHL
jgi:hypothetical protein